MTSYAHSQVDEFTSIRNDTEIVNVKSKEVDSELNNSNKSQLTYEDARKLIEELHEIKKISTFYEYFDRFKSYLKVFFALISIRNVSKTADDFSSLLYGEKEILKDIVRHMIDHDISDKFGEIMENFPSSDRKSRLLILYIYITVVQTKLHDPGIKHVLRLLRSNGKFIVFELGFCFGSYLVDQNGEEDYALGALRNDFLKLLDSVESKFVKHDVFGRGSTEHEKLTSDFILALRVYKGAFFDVIIRLLNLYPEKKIDLRDLVEDKEFVSSLKEGVQTKLLLMFIMNQIVNDIDSFRYMKFYEFQYSAFINCEYMEIIIPSLGKSLKRYMSTICGDKKVDFKLIREIVQYLYLQTASLDPGLVDGLKILIKFYYEVLLYSPLLYEPFSILIDQITSVIYETYGKEKSIHKFLVKYCVKFKKICIKYSKNYRMDLHEKKSTYAILKDYRQSINDDKQFLSTLYSLTTYSDIPVENTNFRIIYPSGLSFLFAFFGSSPLLKDILDDLIRLCKFSVSNYYSIAYGGVDIILMKCLESGSDHAELFLEDIHIVINGLTPEIKKDIILPFLLEITRYSTHEHVAKFLFNYCIKNNILDKFTETFIRSIPTSTCLCSSMCDTPVDIGYRTVQNVREEVGNGFTIHFSLFLDLASSKFSAFQIGLVNVHFWGDVSLRLSFDISSFLIEICYKGSLRCKFVIPFQHEFNSWNSFCITVKRDLVVGFHHIEGGQSFPDQNMMPDDFASKHGRIFTSERILQVEYLFGSSFPGINNGILVIGFIKNLILTNEIFSGEKYSDFLYKMKRKMTSDNLSLDSMIIKMNNELPWRTKSLFASFCGIGVNYILGHLNNVDTSCHLLRDISQIFHYIYLYSSDLDIDSLIEFLQKFDPSVSLFLYALDILRMLSEKDKYVWIQKFILKFDFWKENHKDLCVICDSIQSIILKQIKPNNEVFLVIFQYYEKLHEQTPLDDEHKQLKEYLLNILLDNYFIDVFPFQTVFHRIFDSSKGVSFTIDCIALILSHQPEKAGKLYYELWKRKKSDDLREHLLNEKSDVLRLLKLFLQLGEPPSKSPFEGLRLTEFVRGDLVFNETAYWVTEHYFKFFEESNVEEFINILLNEKFTKGVGVFYRMIVWKEFEKGFVTREYSKRIINHLLEKICNANSEFDSLLDLVFEFCFLRIGYPQDNRNIKLINRYNASPYCCGRSDENKFEYSNKETPKGEPESYLGLRYQVQGNDVEWLDENIYQKLKDYEFKRDSAERELLYEFLERISPGDPTSKSTEEEKRTDARNSLEKIEMVTKNFWTRLINVKVATENTLNMYEKQVENDNVKRVEVSKHAKQEMSVLDYTTYKEEEAVFQEPPQLEFEDLTIQERYTGFDGPGSIGYSTSGPTNPERNISNFSVTCFRRGFGVTMYSTIDGYIYYKSHMIRTHDTILKIIKYSDQFIFVSNSHIYSCNRDAQLMHSFLLKLDGRTIKKCIYREYLILLILDDDSIALVECRVIRTGVLTICKFPKQKLREHRRSLCADYEISSFELSSYKLQVFGYSALELHR